MARSSAQQNDIDSGEVHVPRILVVDDDRSLREIFSDALRQSGYEVRTASSGRTALNVLEAGWVPCVIFLDLRMPDMDGWELSRLIRGDDRWRNIRIVVVAAHARIDREASSIGAEAWLQKPFDLSRLDQQARALCRGCE